MIAVMAAQLAIGILIILGSMVVAAGFWFFLEVFLQRLHPWALRPPHGPKLMVILVLTLLGTFGMVAASVTIWSVAYVVLDIFDAFEAALYFALVAFTTLGFGDVLLPLEWRLLGGFTAANGFFAFGQITALLIETMRTLRLHQRDMGS